MKEILEMMVEEDPNKYSSESISLLSSMLVRNYRPDTRIGIKVLKFLAGTINGIMKMSEVQ